MSDEEIFGIEKEAAAYAFRVWADEEAARQIRKTLRKVGK